MNVLKLTDGTITVDLLAQDNYALESAGWVPSVSNRRISQLGGNGVYEAVDETMEIIVFNDADGITANAALIQLRLLLENAEKWGMGDTTVDPVRMVFQLEDGEQPQENVILGASGGTRIMELPDEHVDLPVHGISYPVTLTFERRGPWLFYPAVANHVQNSSFEQFASGNFANWTKYNVPTVLAQSTSNVRYGGYSGRIVFSSTLDDAIYQDVTTLTDGASYRYSAWVYVVSGATKLTAYDGGGILKRSLVGQ